MSTNKPATNFQEKLDEFKKSQTEKAAELLRAGKSPQEVAEKLCVSVKDLAVLLMDSGMSPKETAEMMGISIRELSLLLSKGNAAKSDTTSVKPSIPAEGQKKRSTTSRHGREGSQSGCQLQRNREYKRPNRLLCLSGRCEDP